MGLLKAMDMRHPRARSIFAAFVLLGALGHFVPRAETQVHQALLVLVSTETGGGDISLGTLRNAYESQPTEHRGTRLIPFNLTIGIPARIQFDRAVLRVAPDRIGAFWIDQKIRFGSSPPRSISTLDMLLRVLVSLKGSIGYAHMAPNAVPAGLVALTVDGKPPTDPAYPLAK